MNRLESQKDLERHREQLKKQRDPQRPLISLCAGSGCGAYGTDEVKDALEREISQNGLKERVEIKVTGCHGFCEKGPIMVIHPEGTFYSQIKVEDVPEIVAETLVNKQLVERLLYKDPVSKQKVSKESEVPFYSHQHRLIFGNNGLIDPTNIDDATSCPPPTPTSSTCAVPASRSCLPSPPRWFRFISPVRACCLE